MKRFLGIFKTNLAIKISAVVFAMILWAYVTTDSDSMQNKTLEQVRVDYSRSQLLDKDLVPAGNSMEAFQDVDVDIGVPFSKYNSVTSNEIIVEADFTTISKPGTYDIKLKASSTISGVEIRAIKPHTIELVVEELVPKTMAVNVETSGELEEGLQHGTPVALTDVTIYGPRKDIERASRAVCTVDLSGIYDDIKKVSYKVKILDSEGAEIPADVFASTPTVSVSMDVLQTKSVKLNYSLANLEGMNNWPAGYTVEDIKLTQDEVLVAAQPELIENLVAVEIQQIDLSGYNLAEQGQVAVKPILPEGVKLAGGVDLKAILTIASPAEEDEPQGTGGMNTFLEGR